MNRHFLVFSVMVLGFAGAAVATTSLSVPCVLLDPHELELYDGGWAYWCSAAINDPNGLRCDQCAPDNNGGHVKCSSTEWDKMHQYDPGQHPAWYKDYSEVVCGGPAIHYTVPTCTGTIWYSQSCFRQFTKPTIISYDFDVGCP